MDSNRDAPPNYFRVHPTAENLAPQQSIRRRWRYDQNRSFTWMILSLLSGVAMAVGHHIFYASFSGLLVDEASIDQTWVIRIGTGFAFITRTLLVVATSIAFVQQRWFTLGSKPFKIRQIDTLTSILGNALLFCKSRIWLRFPLLTVSASIAWLLPIAAVITPATINVVAREEVTNSRDAPPQLYYDPFSYAVLSSIYYYDPSPDVLRTAYSSSTTGQFFGPALRCDHADTALIYEVYDSYQSMYNTTNGTSDYLVFVAWAPSGSERGDLSFLKALDPAFNLDTSSIDSAHLYIIPNTSRALPDFSYGTRTSPDDMHYGYQDLLDCKLYNALYEAFFNCTFPNQSIDIRSLKLLNPVQLSVGTLEYVLSTGDADARAAQMICYQAIMDSFGRMLAGYAGPEFTQTTLWRLTANDWTTRSAAQSGLEQLFQNITLSMLATSSLTMNTSIAAQNQVAINVTSSVNVYEYNPRDLWLAYGIACTATLISTILGVYAMWRNGGVCYQSIFSTFLRTTRDPELQNLIERDDRGAEPLPEKLAESSIILDT